MKDFVFSNPLSIAFLGLVPTIHSSIVIPPPPYFDPPTNLPIPRSNAQPGLSATQEISSVRTVGFTAPTARPPTFWTPTYLWLLQTYRTSRTALTSATRVRLLKRIVDFCHLYMEFRIPYRPQIVMCIRTQVMRVARHRPVWWTTVSIVQSGWGMITLLRNFKGGDCLCLG